MLLLIAATYSISGVVSLPSNLWTLYIVQSEHRLSSRASPLASFLMGTRVLKPTHLVILWQEWKSTSVNQPLSLMTSHRATSVRFGLLIVNIFTSRIIGLSLCKCLIHKYLWRRAGRSHKSLNTSDLLLPTVPRYLALVHVERVESTNQHQAKNWRWVLYEYLREEGFFGEVVCHT